MSSALLHGDSDGLLTYVFLLPLVMKCLNDGDVVTRLLILNKTIRRMMPKYSFKRMCQVKEALQVIEASRDIMFSVRRIKTWNSDPSQLLRLQQANKASFIEVIDVKSIESPLDIIPHFATHLHLTIDSSSRFPVPILLPAGMIPDSVVDLYIGDGLVLQTDSLPLSIRTVKLTLKLDEFDADVIPDSVTNLSLYESDESARGALRGPFPDSLKCLHVIEHYLPFSAGVIPTSVTTFACGSKLLSMLEAGVLPNSVKSVLIQWCKGWVPKPDVLPDSITFMRVDSTGPVHFAFPLRWMPTSLTHLVLNMRNVMTIPAGIIPGTLTHFRCNCEIAPGALPHGVTHVHLIEGAGFLCQGVLPQSVTHLKLISTVPQLTPGMIPSSVTHLQFGCSVWQQMIPGIIPNSVTHLAFQCNLEYALNQGVIPQSVTHLMFRDPFGALLSRYSLPDNLTHLCVGDGFNQRITGDIIPRTVTYLVLGHAFNQPILSGDIPPSVTHLAFSSSYTHELDSTTLPCSLTHLEIPRGYLKSDDKLWLPSSVTHISYKSQPDDERPEMEWNKWCVTAGMN